MVRVVRVHKCWRRDRECPEEAEVEAHLLLADTVSIRVKSAAPKPSKVFALLRCVSSYTRVQTGLGEERPASRQVLIYPRRCKTTPFRSRTTPGEAQTDRRSLWPHGSESSKGRQVVLPPSGASRRTPKRCMAFIITPQLVLVLQQAPRKKFKAGGGSGAAGGGGGGGSGGGTKCETSEGHPRG